MSSLVLKQPKTGMIAAYGEQSVTERRPITQISAQYGFNEQILAPSGGGASVSAVNGNFVTSTGVGPGGVAAILSSREAVYRPGQGLICLVSALFSGGVSNSTQLAGFITSESILAFGYNGADFGIVHASGGQLEIQELEITVAPTGSETAIVAVDDTVFIIPSISGSIQNAAQLIAEYLTDNDPRYNYTANSATITCQATIPDIGSGGFTFSSSGTMAAAWTEIKPNNVPTETWTNKEDWNVNPNINIDPQFGNVYCIQVEYLGYGSIKFFVEDPDTGELELVHILKFPSTLTEPSVTNPSFRAGWACRNTGNTSNVEVKGASAAAFIEGSVFYDNLPRGALGTQTTIGASTQNVISYRNRLVINGETNRSEIIPRTLFLSNEGSKGAEFSIIRSPDFASVTEWNYFDESDSFMETNRTLSSFVSADIIASIAVGPGQSIQVDMRDVIPYISPSSFYSIACRRIGAGSNIEVSASLIWIDDV